MNTYGVKRPVIVVVFLVLFMLIFGACTGSQADVASRNLSQAADQFQIVRKVIFYNGITGDYIYSMEGLCSIEDQVIQLEVTCKMEDGLFVKHFQGLSDNVTYTVLQLSAKPVSEYRYKMYVRPETVLPDVELDVSFDK